MATFTKEQSIQSALINTAQRDLLLLVNRGKRNVAMQRI